MKKVHEIPSLHSLSLKTSTLGMPLGRNRVTEVVPRRYLDEFLRVQFGNFMKDGWWDRAHDSLAEMAPEGDWEEAGLKLDEEFPQYQRAADYYQDAKDEWEKICINKKRQHDEENWKKLCEGDADWVIEADDKDDEKSITKDDLSDLIIEAYEELEMDFWDIESEEEMNKVFEQLKTNVYEQISSDSDESSDEL